MTGTTMGKMATWLARSALVLGIPVLICEASLRSLPSLVPPKVLAHFQPELRSRMAEGRFTTRKEMQLVARDDGGPDLWIYQPFVEKHYDFADPGVVRVVQADEVGFCNPPGSYQARDRIDLIAIGDSFTWCHAVAVEDTWPIQLGRRTGIASYNLGKGGIGVDEYLQLLKHYGLPREPRVVVMNLYEGNDFRDRIRFRSYRSTGGASEEASPGVGWHDSWLGRSSVSVNLAMAALDRARASARRSSERRSINFRYLVAEGDVEVPFNRDHLDRDEISVALRLARGEVSLDYFDAALETYAEMAREHGFLPVLSYSPSAHTAYAAFTRFEVEAHKALLQEFSRSMRSYFRARSAELGLFFLDLTPTLREHASPIDPESLLYYPTSLHFTTRAHAIVADALEHAIAGALRAHESSAGAALRRYRGSDPILGALLGSPRP